MRLSLNVGISVCRLVASLWLLILWHPGLLQAKDEMRLPLRGYQRASEYTDIPASVEPNGFWGINQRYVHSPRVEWKPVDGAARYELILVQGDRMLGITEAAASPHFIENGWNKIKAGRPANVIIQAFDAKGKRVGLSWMFGIYVAPDFNPKACAKMKRPYREAATKAFDALYDYEDPGLKFPAEGPASEIFHSILSACDGSECNYTLNASWYVDMVESMLKIADAPLKAKLLAYARSVGDYVLLSRVPAEGHVYGGLVRGCVDLRCNDIVGGLAGIRRSEVVEPCSSAISGEALVKVYEMTHDVRYLDAATVMAEVLVTHQSEDGSWPSRVDGKTGEVITEYTSSVGLAALLFDRLNKHRPNERWVTARDRAVRWVMQNPMKTYGWALNFPDVPAPNTKANPYLGGMFSNFDLYHFVRYLCRHPESVSNVYSHVKEQMDWADNMFVFYGPDPLLTYEPFYPSVAEQGIPMMYFCAGSPGKATGGCWKTDTWPLDARELHRLYLGGGGGCWTPMHQHTANWALTLIEIYRLTKESRWLEMAKAAANVLTQYQLEDGRTLTWLPDRTFGTIAHFMGIYKQGLFFTADFAISAQVWAELAAIETESRKVSTTATKSSKRGGVKTHRP